MGKEIMIQGTMSNAGKSLLGRFAIAFFKSRTVYRGAPFKSQNGTQLLYYRRGLEMGRAQVMLAEAADKTAGLHESDSFKTNE